MVKHEKKHSQKTRTKQPSNETLSEPPKISALTPYDFSARNLTPYGGLLPIATMLERLGFQALVEGTISCARKTRAMSPYKFILGIVLGLYVGFPRLNQLRFIARDPMLTGILNEPRLPPQSTLWRFMAGLHLNVAAQMLRMQKIFRQRVWEAANVKLEVVTIDTDTTVHTLYGKQMGGRKAYNPKNKGKLSYQPILTFVAETKEYLWGDLRNGARPTGKQIQDHLRHAIAALPGGVKQIFARADAGFYCHEAVEAYEEGDCQFVIVAHKTSRLVEKLEQAEWKPARQIAAGEECEFLYQPAGWSKAYRFVAQRYPKSDELEQEAEQYQLFETSRYNYSIFVTNMPDSVDFVAWFYHQRAAAENLIKEANNDAGLTAHPSGRFDVNRNHFQFAMLAYNLNCWLMLFNRKPQDDVATLKHTTLATSRLRFLFIAAKIWSHAGRTGIHYGDHYEEKGMFQQLMYRLRRIASRDNGFVPIMTPALR